MNMLACPVCESAQVALFMNGIFDSGETDVMECAKCGLQFLHPMMSDGEENEYYRLYYENQKKRQYKNLSLKDIQDNSFGHYSQYLGIYAGLIENKKSILEIGSGTGGFLRFVKARAPDITLVSVERSGPNLDFLRHEFKDVQFNEAVTNLDTNARFDLIAVFGVFEHVKDNARFLKMTGEHLNPGGTLALNIPNKRNPLVYTYGVEEFKKFAYMKQHYYTYTERSLEILAEKTGYEIEKYHYMQVWGLDNHLSWLRYGKPRDFSQFTQLLSDTTLQSYNDDLISKKTTDLMMVIMEKRGRREVPA